MEPVINPWVFYLIELAELQAVQGGEERPQRMLVSCLLG